MHSLEILYRINARPDPVERGIPIRQMTLLIKKSFLEQGYPGGVAGFLATHHAREYEHLIRYVSMSSGEIQQVLDGLIAVGVDINQACAIAEYSTGPVASCPGIDFYTTSMPNARMHSWEARLVPLDTKRHDKPRSRPLPKESGRSRAVAHMSAKCAADYFETQARINRAVISRSPYLVFRIMNSVFQYETITIGEGGPEVRIGSRVSLLRHPEPYAADGSIGSEARALLIQGVKEAVQRTGFRMCIVWGEQSCSYVEKDGEVIESTERPSGGFCLIPDPKAFRFRSRQSPDGAGLS